MWSLNFPAGLGALLVAYGIWLLPVYKHTQVKNIIATCIAVLGSIWVLNFLCTLIALITSFFTPFH